MRQLLFFFLRHLILLLVLAYLGLGYYFRGPIFGLQDQPTPSVPPSPATSSLATPSPAISSPATSDPQAGAISGTGPGSESDTQSTRQAVPQAVLQQPAAEASGSDFLSLQQQARTLADSGQFEVAEAAYLQLIQAFPEVAEPYGELGNLYLAADQAEKAAQAYLDAGKRIDPKLSPSQLEGLIQTLQTLSPDKAELLKQHLSQP